MRTVTSIGIGRYGIPHHCGLQSYGGLVENVDIESQNAGANGVQMVGGGTFRGGIISGAAGGSVSYGIQGNDYKPARPSSRAPRSRPLSR